MQKHRTKLGFDGVKLVKTTELLKIDRGYNSVS